MSSTEDGVCGPFMVLVPHNEEAGFAHSQAMVPASDRCFLGRCWCRDHAEETPVQAQSHLGSA